ncbi:hypothetical protein ZHAS_00009553 [Anopheles sinensis]|uniref:Uncharacterized protein n=1 Tax=Anopheles sinensis TaxID=74873 RepID=A0A084VVI8_ANOSI|nr:hypothetical protein ZHAS_00009553 [Anopheles sinensis]
MFGSPGTQRCKGQHHNSRSLKAMMHGSGAQAYPSWRTQPIHIDQSPYIATRGSEHEMTAALHHRPHKYLIYLGDSPTHRHGGGQWPRSFALPHLTHGDERWIRSR